jgi:hypothetical protein
VAAGWSYDHRADLIRESTALPSIGGLDIQSLTVDAAYRFPLGLAARLRIPILWKSFVEQDAPERDLFGLGDLEISATRDLIRTPAFVGTVGVGLALPTGATTRQPIVGAAVPTPLQLGSGTFDPILLGFAAYAPLPELDGHILVDARPVLYANGFSYRASSVYVTAVGAEYHAWSHRLAISADLEWAHSGHAEVNGAEFPNTGRDVLYVSPRIRVLTFAGVALETGVRVPIVQVVNQTQFGETLAINVRLSYASPPLGEPHRHRDDGPVIVSR